MSKRRDVLSRIGSGKNRPVTRLRARSRRLGFCLVMVVLFAPIWLSPSPALSQQPSDTKPSMIPVGEQSSLRATIRQSDAVQGQILISVGKSTVVEANKPLVQVAVASPDIADVVMMSPMQVLVTGKTVGMTQLILSDDKNEQAVFDVTVEPDLARLKSMIEQTAPGSSINVDVLKGTIVLSGEASCVDEVDRIVNLAKIIAPDVQNQMTVAGEQQVLLRCTFAEVDKKAVRELGVNGWLAGDNIRDVFVVNQLSGINPVNIGAAGGQEVIVPNGLIFATDQEGLNLRETTTFSLGFPRVQMQLFFNALRQNNLLKVLAEPNLVAFNGQQASFIAGGEYPVPVAQGNGAVGIIYKNYGILLNFTPMVIGRQMIRLDVGSEVSELDFSSAVELLGFVVPGLTKRSANTTIELASGTTIAIAGLLSEQVRGNAQAIPGLGEIPVLGQLFRSVHYQRSVTELVILVTPELVSGMNPEEVAAIPGQFSTPPNDWQLFGLGMVEGEPMVDGSAPERALETDIHPSYRKFSSPPEQMSLHGPWGHAEISEAIQ